MRDIINTVDSYKLGHSSMLRPDCTSQYNYLESRIGAKLPYVVFVGLQYYIKKYLSKVPTKKQIKKHQKRAIAHAGSFDYDMWMRINQLGYYPIIIKAIPEGTLVPTGCPLCTVEPTDPECVGIVGIIETLLMKVWMPTSVATKSFYVKQLLLKYGIPDWANFAYHNFGNRSCTAEEHAMIAGFAHLTSFLGTDSYGSLEFAEKYYNQSEDVPAGYSVLATEHSVTTMNGRDGEEAFVLRVLQEHPKAKIVSVVADSYSVLDFTEFCTKPNGAIRKHLEISGQKLVLRPDSGDPIKVLSDMITIMRKNNCGAIADDGKYYFNGNYGILWGDGITIDVIKDILEDAKKHNFAAENLVFGSGTNLVNDFDRDTLRFAIKCSSATIGGKETDVYKDPVTDTSKKSKRGRVTTIITPEEILVPGYDNEMPITLEVAFHNGRIYSETSLDGIRNKINKQRLSFKDE